jgi:hypothetical protein
MTVSGDALTLSVMPVCALLFTLLSHCYYYYCRYYSTVPAAAKATCAAIAAQCLVDKLNAEAGSTVYAYIKPATAPPTDYIANGIIYRIGVVTPVGAPQLLTYTPAAKSRDSLIQVYYLCIPTTMLNSFTLKRCSQASTDHANIHVPWYTIASCMYAYICIACICIACMHHMQFMSLFMHVRTHARSALHIHTVLCSSVHACNLRSTIVQGCAGSATQ